MLLMAEFFYRFLTNRPFGGAVHNGSVATFYERRISTKLRSMSIALCFATVFLFIRYVDPSALRASN